MVLDDDEWDHLQDEDRIFESLALVGKQNTNVSSEFCDLYRNGYSFILQCQLCKIEAAHYESGNGGFL